MKKLMIAAVAAAMVGGAYAACERCVISKDVARVYQVQMNVYTTKGVLIAPGAAENPSTCVRGGTTYCKVMRGKDKTVFRGYVYVCNNLCEMSEYAAAFADVRRGCFFGEIDATTGELVDGAEFTWDWANVIGKNSTDAECAWTFEATPNYDTERVQTWELRGAGYGKYVHSTEGFFDNLGGYFAGTASASYDLSTRNPNLIDLKDEDDELCICKPSQVLKCDAVDGVTFVDERTVAFGAWKMKFNANVTKAYLANGAAIFPSLLQKMFK